MTIKRSLFATVFLILLFFQCLSLDQAFAQGLTIGNGGVVSLGDSTWNFNCNDIRMAGGGTLNAQDATVETSRHVTIDPGGTLNGGNGVISFCGTWTNNGTLNWERLSVIPYSGCGVPNIFDSGKIPALTGSGMAIMVVLIAFFGLIILRRRRELQRY